MKELKVYREIDPYESTTSVYITDGGNTIWSSSCTYKPVYTYAELKKEVQDACDKHSIKARLSGPVESWTGMGPGKPGGMRFADVGDGVWVGEYRACDEHGHDFSSIIHIWRPENWKEHRFCKRLHGSTSNQFGNDNAVRWEEGQRLYEMSITLDRLRWVVDNHGKLLVHCAGGICRSLTLAIVCKVIRGRDVFEAIKDVYERIWPVYHNPPDFRAKTVEDVINWSLNLPFKENK